jgi:phosphatidylserine/phosphatidylglycerophosphate/cardiolipin synthase-like enzyme
MSALLRQLIVALAVAALAATAGCTLSRERVRRADATIAAQQDTTVSCPTSDACAAPSPYRRLYAMAVEATAGGTPVHYANILDTGADSLALRVHLIRSARHSIDLQTFIFAEDDAGYLVLDELVKAARRGVRVRVLADQLFSIGDDTLLARLASAHANFELRLYNPTFDKASTPPLEFAASILCCFFRFNQRMHNKLLLIDDETGIAGGRNYENRYFDWDEEFDYRDRDVLVTGPMAGRQMHTSFEAFWSHDRTRTMARLKDVNRRVLSSRAPPAGPWTTPQWARPDRVAALSAQADDTAWIDTHYAGEALRVGRVDYFSDSPNKPLEPENRADQELTRHIISLLDAAQREIVMQTPYLVISRPARKVFRELRHRHPALRVIVSTNSLAATDAFYVYALSHKYKKRYIKDFHFEIHEFKPFPADAADMIIGYAALAGGGETDDRFRKFDRTPLKRDGVRVGLHAKSIVIDGAVTLIGSHNFDPRSDNYNTESGFIIHDVPFAQALRASILRDTAPRNAWTIAKRPRPVFFERINNAISDFSTALPLFDFWPFRYATSFEIRPGCEPRRPTDPDFYDCYDDVGDFPEVDLPLKTIYTRIVTAFGAGLVGIL